MRDASFAGVDRWLWETAPELGASPVGAGGPTLEIASGPSEPPRLADAVLLEDTTLRSHVTDADAAPVFGAFLDGTQASRVIRQADGLPIVHGTVAAVVRQRVHRRLTTWRHQVRGRVYAPRALLSSRWNHLLDQVADGATVVDTSSTDDRGHLQPIAHPFAVRDAASHQVQADREALEHELAEAWCAARDEPLLLDGGTSGSERLASREHLVGVIKSHRTLYASGSGLDVVRGLVAGERSSVFRVSSAHRASVASWYLRLRPPHPMDWMWGLVRIEVSDSVDGAAAWRRRADQISAWVLAERTPLALPDARWDRMMYGIRDCEEFLRAVI